MVVVILLGDAGKWPGSAVPAARIERISRNVPLEGRGARGAWLVGKGPRYASEQSGWHGGCRACGWSGDEVENVDGYADGLAHPFGGLAGRIVRGAVDDDGG